MFCGQCGTPNIDSARFCLSCGAQLQPSQPDPAPAPAEAPQSPAPAKRSHKKLVIWLIVLSLVIAAGATGACLALRKNTPRKVVLAAMDAVYAADADVLFDLLPAEILEEQFGGRNGQKAAKRQLQESLDELVKSINNTVEEFELEYDVIHVQKLPDAAFQLLQEEYEDEYNCQIDAAKEVTIKQSITYEDAYQVQTMVYNVVKIDGKWYLDFAFYMDLI